MSAILEPPPRLDELLARSVALHNHLCPRQILGARMGLLAGQALGMAVPRTDKKLMVLAETDGCFADGLSVATGCWLGRRTLRLVDHGKVAATFVEVRTGQAVRIAPHTDLRARVRAGRAEGVKRWDAYMDAYQTWEDQDLFTVMPIRLTLDLAAVISVNGKRAICDACGEEIINEREVRQEESVLCRDCAGQGYWQMK
ncbi:FmdE family protein [Deinococcus sp. AJ005]|uniref:FmdE family protein n=1 Tax=Deinococcus sp. AJ005 TaxID=2652443 RepID=UPI00125CBE95|nr:FmdE family protein [Deinococcus sp. AJ005]QFP77038.1 formylmethanofuran dehydrogenase [Deinococcus sp. AJ005]